MEKCKDCIHDAVCGALEEMNGVPRIFASQCGFYERCELPCKIGDTLWYYDEGMWGVIPCVMDRPYHLHCGEPGGCTFETYFAPDDVGKIVFHTCEECEAARDRIHKKRQERAKRPPMTYKQFREWCTLRVHDGMWGHTVVITCIEVMGTVDLVPFWCRERVWRKLRDMAGIEEMIEAVNEKIRAALEGSVDEEKVD